MKRLCRKRMFSKKEEIDFNDENVNINDGYNSNNWQII